VTETSCVKLHSPVDFARQNLHVNPVDCSPQF
jgi:hypothetical protein